MELLAFARCNCFWNCNTLGDARALQSRCNQAGKIRTSELNFYIDQVRDRKEIMSSQIDPRKSAQNYDKLQRQEA